MTKTESHATVRIVLQDGEPYIESRLRAVDDAEDGPIRKGKILVLRTPLLTPGTSEAETESELIDDDGSAALPLRFRFSHEGEPLGSVAR